MNMKPPIIFAQLLGAFLSLALFCSVSDQQADAASVERIQIDDDGAGFIRSQSRTAFVPWGVNYDHDRDGRLIEDYWGDEWESVVEDFHEIKALGANAVRVHLQFSSFMRSPDRPNEQSLEKLADLCRLAEETGLYLNITGLGCYHIGDVHDWYDAMSETERWRAQAAFWSAVARTCAGSPAVFCYDLMNEPVIGGGDSESREWLTGELGGKHFVQRITLDAEGRDRKQIAAEWVSVLVEAIRKHDKKTLVTVGVIPWAHVWEGAKPVFYSPETGELLDFISVHFYPKSGEIDPAISALKVYDLGRPLVIEEMFPLSCSIEEMETFVERSRVVADGWFSFYWGMTVEEYEENSTMKSAIISKWLNAFQALGEE